MIKKVLFVTSIIFISAVSFSQWINVATLTGTGTNYPSISVVDDNVVWTAGGSAGAPVIWRSTNNGLNFTSITPPPCFELTCIYGKSASECYVADGGSSGYLGGNAKFYKTTNAGANWILINQTGGTSGFFEDINFSRVSPSDGIALSNPPTGSGPFFLLRTSDAGLTWNPETPGSVSGANAIWHCTIIYNATGFGFGIDGGFFSRARATTDGGASWQTLPILMTGSPIASFAYSDINTLAIASTSSAVARTTDQGLSWQTVNSGGAACLRWVSGTNICYMLSANIIKKSTDEGATWSSMTIAGVSGLKHFDFAAVGNIIYGFGITSGGVVIKLTESITGISKIEEQVPDGFSLSQNYPNPFNPSTKINFSIPQVGQRHAFDVQLSIYDILGREIASLVNENLQPGSYSVTWDASNVPSGTYFYKLTAGDPSRGSGHSFTETKKMTLMK